MNAACAHVIPPKLRLRSSRAIGPQCVRIKRISANRPLVLRVYSPPGRGLNLGLQLHQLPYKPRCWSLIIRDVLPLNASVVGVIVRDDLHFHRRYRLADAVGDRSTGNTTAEGADRPFELDIIDARAALAGADI